MDKDGLYETKVCCYNNAYAFTSDLGRTAKLNFFRPPFWGRFRPSTSATITC